MKSQILRQGDAQKKKKPHTHNNTTNKKKAVVINYAKYKRYFTHTMSPRCLHN